VAHIAGGLRPYEVVEAVLEALERNRTAEGGPEYSVVLFCSEEDDPLLAYQTAQLAVEYSKKGVRGFGFHGEFASDGLQYYRASLDCVKDASMDTVIFTRSAHQALMALHSGYETEKEREREIETFVLALVICRSDKESATRLSGAFGAHLDPLLMTYLSTHSIPVEIGLTDVYALATSDIGAFVHPIRLFFDKQIPIAICSFRGMFSPPRVQMLERIVSECVLCSFVSGLVILYCRVCRIVFMIVPSP
jgi:hypothetical protein